MANPFCLSITLCRAEHAELKRRRGTRQGGPHDCEFAFGSACAAGERIEPSDLDPAVAHIGGKEGIMDHAAHHTRAPEKMLSSRKLRADGRHLEQAA
jgi:hypothetical protein